MKLGILGFLIMLKISKYNQIDKNKEAKRK